MKLKKKISAAIITLLLFSIVPQQVLVQAEAASETKTYSGARAASNDLGELFLGGNYMELGISNWGDFGTVGAKPENFNGTSATVNRKNIGMSVAHDGFDAPNAKPMDYYLPGTPEERFAVGYQIGEKTYSASNMALDSSGSNLNIMLTDVTDESDIAEGKLQAKIVSVWIDTMEITQIVSFSENDKVFKNEVTIKNISTETWDNARYMRSLDPDNTVDISGGSAYTTKNTVTHTIEQDGIALVKAEAIKGEPYPLFFYSSDIKAKGSIFGFDNDNPYEDKAYDNPAARGVPIVDDIGMTMTWESHNALAPNDSETYVYYTSLDSRDPLDIIADIDNRVEGFTENENNDGTIDGKYRVAISGGRLQDTIDANYLTVNNLPLGLTLGEVTRVSDTELEFTLKGQAINHESQNSVTNASLTVGRENILVGVKDITSETFKITFFDKAKAYIKSSTVTESVYGSGEVTGDINVKISDSYLKESLTNGDIVIINLPEGLSYTLERVSDTEFIIKVTGTAEVIGDVLNASITIKGSALVGSQDQDVSTNTFYINFTDKEPFLFIENPILKESVANDGSFTEAIKLKLYNATFKDKSVIDEIYSVTDAVYGIHFPEGIEIDSFTIDSSTEMTVILKGKATNAASLHNISDAQLSINKGIVTINDPDLVLTEDTIASNTISFYFIDDNAMIELVNSKLYIEMDNSISEKLVVKSKNGTFDPSISLDDITVNNLPNGIILNELLLFSDSELILTVAIPVVADLALDSTAKFASISINASKVTGATDRLTTQSFAFIARKNDDVTWDIIRNGNALQTSVSSHLNLIKEVTGSKVTWKSSKPEIVLTEGVVARSSLKKDEEVKLTATFKLDGVTVTREFNIIVVMIQSSPTTTKPKDTVNISAQSPSNTNVVPLTLEKSDENGKLSGSVSISDSEAKEIVNQTKDDMNKLVIIEVPDSFDSDEFTLNIDKEASKKLSENQVIVEVHNQGAVASIDGATLSTLSGDLYLRLIPVKAEQEQEHVKGEIQALAQTKKINTVGQPLKVETNLDNKNVTLYLPLDGVKIPNNEAEKQQLFKRLGVYASYDNGEDALITGTIVEREEGKFGIEFTMNQAGTFSLAAVSASADKYIIGYPDGEFKPNESVTRGQIALMFARNMGFVTTGEYTDQKYSDLSGKHYANQAVGFMSEASLMNGYEDGTFKANKSMTRAEVMSIAIKYLGIEIHNTADVSFNDTSNHWAKYIIEAARKIGLIDANEVDFRPNDELTRIEAVYLLNLLFEREPVASTAKPSFSDVSPDTPGFGQIEESVKEFSGVFIEVK